MKFSYKAISASGSKDTGSIEALSVQDAMRELKRQGLTPLDIQLEQLVGVGIKGRVKRGELLQFLDELVTLLRAGVSLADAISSQSDAHFNPVLATTLQKLSSGLQQGRQLSDVLKSSSLDLPKYMYQLVSAGEMSGKLAEAIAEGVEQMRFEEQLATEAKNALIYPFVLVATGIVAVGLVFSLVVPKFSNLLDGKVELPWLASIVLRSGVFFNENGLWVLLALVVVVSALVSLFSKPLVQERAIDYFAQWPIIGPWLVESETGRWTAVLGALLANGVPLMDSLALANQGIRIPSRRKIGRAHV